MNANSLWARSARLGLLLTLVFVTVRPILDARAQSDPGSQTATKQNIPDVKLVDQDEKTVHLYSDLAQRTRRSVELYFYDLYDDLPSDWSKSWSVADRTWSVARRGYSTRLGER